MDVTYYYIKDLNSLGKIEEHIPFLYETEKGWVLDDRHILMDRIMGYDESEPSDFPYKIGNLYIMDFLKEISAEEAENFIKSQ
jgi:hypothetical protein